MNLLKKTIKIIEPHTKEDKEAFWKAKNECFIEDIFPDSDLGEPITEEDKEYFLSEEYYGIIENLCDREIDKARKVFFCQDGKIVGFSLYCTYLSEDGKCFILDFCILREYRNKGIGKICFSALKDDAGNNGAVYYQLNTHCERSKRFWESLGFIGETYDDHGVILLTLDNAFT